MQMTRNVWNIYTRPLPCSLYGINISHVYYYYFRASTRCVGYWVDLGGMGKLPGWLVIHAPIYVCPDSLVLSFSESQSLPVSASHPRSPPLPSQYFIWHLNQILLVCCEGWRQSRRRRRCPPLVMDFHLCRIDIAVCLVILANLTHIHIQIHTPDNNKENIILF